MENSLLLTVVQNVLFLSMDPLYPTGLDENHAVDDLYTAYVVKLHY